MFSPAAFPPSGDCGLPSRISPASMKTTRFATCRASPISCVTQIIVIPSSARETIVSSTACVLVSALRARHRGPRIDQAEVESIVVARPPQILGRLLEDGADLLRPEIRAGRLDERRRARNKRRRRAGADAPHVPHVLVEAGNRHKRNTRRKGRREAAKAGARRWRTRGREGRIAGRRRAGHARRAGTDDEPRLEAGHASEPAEPEGERTAEIGRASWRERGKV